MILASYTKWGFLQYLVKSFPSPSGLPALYLTQDISFSTIPFVNRKLVSPPAPPHAVSHGLLGDSHRVPSECLAPLPLSNCPWPCTYAVNSKSWRDCLCLWPDWLHCAMAWHDSPNVEEKEGNFPGGRQGIDFPHRDWLHFRLKTVIEGGNSQWGRCKAFLCKHWWQLVTQSNWRGRGGNSGTFLWLSSQNRKGDRKPSQDSCWWSRNAYVYESISEEVAIPSLETSNHFSRLGYWCNTPLFWPGLEQEY